MRFVFGACGKREAEFGRISIAEANAYQRTSGEVGRDRRSVDRFGCVPDIRARAANQLSLELPD